MTRSLLRKPTMPVTLVPCSCSAWAMGSAMAQPTPPPTTQTFFRPSISVALPKGPTKSCTASPSFRAFSCIVPAPTIWKMMETVPASRSKPAMVRGMRSESSFARTMINWPAFAFLAMSGAWMQSSVTVGFNSLRFTMVNIVLLILAQNVVFWKKRMQTGEPKSYASPFVRRPSSPMANTVILSLSWFSASR